MAKLNFKLSDGQKHDALWSLLNSKYNEENNWEITYSICECYDDYALVRNYETGSFERAYYIKDDSSNTIEINKIEKCYVLDITEQEKNALDALRVINNGTYEKIDEIFAETKNNLETANLKVNEFEQKIGELNNSVSTLTTERDNEASKFNEAQNTISSLTEELDGLKQYKLNKEKDEKNAILSSYAELLAEDVLATYTEEKVASFTAVELDKELAYEVKKSNPSVFSKKPQLLLKDEPLTGIEAILAKYKKD